MYGISVIYPVHVWCLHGSVSVWLNVTQKRLFPVIKKVQILPGTCSLDLYFAKYAINNYMGVSSE